MAPDATAGTVGGVAVRVGFLGAGLIATYHSKSLRRSGADVVRAGAVLLGERVMELGSRRPRPVPPAPDWLA